MQWTWAIYLNSSPNPGRSSDGPVALGTKTNKAHQRVSRRRRPSRVRLSSAAVSQKSVSTHARALRRPKHELGCQMERRSWPKPPRPRAEAPASGLPCWDEQYLRMCVQKIKQYSANKCIFQWWPLNQNTLLSMFDRSKTTYQTPLPLIADKKIGNMSFTYAFLISEQW